MNWLIDPEVGTSIRVLIRAVCLVLTAFVAGLSVEQVAGIQLVLEAVLGVPVAIVKALNKRLP